MVCGTDMNVRFQKNRVDHLEFLCASIFSRPDNLQTRIFAHFCKITKLAAKCLLKGPV